MTSLRAQRSPLWWLRYELTPKSRVGRLLPARPLPAAHPAEVTELPTAVDPEPLSDADLAYLRRHRTNALIVVRHGAIVTEWYGRGWQPEWAHTSWSMAKSLLSLLAGALAEEGRLDLARPVADILPELRGDDSRFRRVTVQHLLDMRSGIRLDERYGRRYRYVGVQGMYMATDLPGYLRAQLELFAEPGSASVYRSVDAQWLALVLARVSGATLTALTQRLLWSPLGAEFPASWSLDRPGGTELAFGSFNAAARDYARLGAAVANGGLLAGRQIIAPGWLQRISTPRGQFPLEPGWDYSALWWHPPGWREHQDFAARGYYGQHLYVQPRRGVVVVKLADDPHEDAAATVSLLRRLAER